MVEVEVDEALITVAYRCSAIAKEGLGVLLVSDLYVFNTQITPIDYASAVSDGHFKYIDETPGESMHFYSDILGLRELDRSAVGTKTLTSSSRHVTNLF